MWVLSFAGQTVHLKNSVGMHDLVQLLAQPEQDFSAEYLVSGAIQAPITKPGELLDKRALSDCRRRIQEILIEKEEAVVLEDDARYGRLEEEEDSINAALRAAVGLGGRQRVFNNPAEKARKAVSARVRASVSRIEALHPALGKHLRIHVKTGRMCSYKSPDKILWIL